MSTPAFLAPYLLPDHPVREQMNQWGIHQIPFLFIIDFEGLKPIALPLAEVNPECIQYQIGSWNNFQYPPQPLTDVHWKVKHPDPEAYRVKFDFVMEHLRYGNSYLTNLTMPSRITLDCDPYLIFRHAQAPYKLFLKGECCVFSPESFVKIHEDGTIDTFPMKGTRTQAQSQTHSDLLLDKKEQAEQATITDLMRNDLHGIATQVLVPQFKYIQSVVTHRGPLYQMSSHITGQLGKDWKMRLGDLLYHLLPAGSISGAPKTKTCAIIRQAENEPRGYYTGVFGVFDGLQLHSAVMIRYIEITSTGYRYRSGGGITVNSQFEKEYQELCDKVYLPIESMDEYLSL